MKTQYNHPEWEKENSLTSPSDRIPENKWKPDQGGEKLTTDEVNNALNVLNNDSFTKKFPKIDRTYADPAIIMQLYGLISFTPAKNAKPNENGVFGFAKLRGNYATEQEALQRSEFLIRNVDSYHQIYHTYVGRPFPITSSSDYSAEVSEIDIRRETTKAVSENIKEKKRHDKKEINTMKEREKELLKDCSEESEDPYETFITLKVKKAQLSWTYLEHLKKIEEVKRIIVKTRQILQKNEFRTSRI